MEAAASSIGRAMEARASTSARELLEAREPKPPAGARDAAVVGFT
jgi:hypothetical protein